MFYDQYLLLCEKAGKRPYEVARELGCSNSNVAQWKKGSVPRKSMLEKIADYFDVTIGYLVDGYQKEKPTDQQVSELSADEVTRKLFSMIAEASGEERLKMKNIIEYVLSQREVNET